MLMLDVYKEIKCEICGQAEMLLDTEGHNHQCVKCAKDKSIYAGVLCSQFTNKDGVRIRGELQIEKTNPRLSLYKQMQDSPINFPNGSVFFTTSFFPSDTIKL